MSKYELTRRFLYIYLDFYHLILFIGKTVPNSFMKYFFLLLFLMYKYIYEHKLHKTQ